MAPAGGYAPHAPRALAHAGAGGATTRPFGMISSYLAAGLSKFVVRPAAVPASFEKFVAGFAGELMPLQG